MLKIIREVDHDELPESARDLNPDFNPLAEGIFMAHQKSWVADESDLKLCKKGRRTGITWAEAQDDTLIAASAPEAGGDNVFYIGDTKDKGLEWIGYVAHFARFIEGHRPAIHEFEDDIEYVDDDGKRIVERISGFTVKFDSGFRCSALASRPEVIRGLQGVVVIDEAAFHTQVRRVIDACNALLIWGGRIRIISTHNGVKNPFNDLVKEAEAGKAPYSVHCYTFDDAVRNGIFERVCMKRGETPTPEGFNAWYKKVRGSYGTRIAAMKEELDVIPQEGAGKLLTMVQIEACMTRDYVVKRWTPPDEGFVDWPQEARRAIMQLWLNTEIAPILDTFPKNRMTAVGGDFAMRQDRSCYPIGYTAQDLVRHVPLILELWRVPYDQ
ncbi:MAG TPA: hypothetical protein DEB21_20645, partial [Rhodospirillaceae bacterium]|nr:hypothetical protein [Rhodospirillaceae bacterium]